MADLRVTVQGEDSEVRASVVAELEAAGIVETGDDDAGILIVAGRLTVGFNRADFTPLGLPLVLCTPSTGVRSVRKALESGVDGIVWSDQLGTRLVPTVRAVAAGQIVVPREAWRPSEEQELTNREKQVLALVIMGLSNGEIATKLYLTESTVKSHLSSSFRKLGVRSRAEAARVIADPEGGLGTGILAITPTSSSGRSAAR